MRGFLISEFDLVSCNKKGDKEKGRREEKYFLLLRFENIKYIYKILLYLGLKLLTSTFYFNNTIL